MNDLTRVKHHNPARLFRDALSLPAAFFPDALSLPAANPETLSHFPQPCGRMVF
jgi:hypothetical protein